MGATSSAWQPNTLMAGATDILGTQGFAYMLAT